MANKRQIKKQLKKLKEKSETDPYSKYMLTIKENRLNIKRVFSRSDFATATADLIQKGQDYSPEMIARRQSWGGITENQMKARFRAAQRLFPEKNFRDEEDFIRHGGLDLIDDEIAKLVEANPHLTAVQMAALITRTIFSPED